MSTSMVRVGAVVLGCLACTGLAACGGVGRLDASPSHVVDLSGHWVLDHSVSDNPQPLLEKLRPRANSNNGDLSPDGTAGIGDNGPPDGQGGSRGGGRGRRGQQSPQMVYRGNDAFERGSVLRALKADLARDEEITVRETPEQFSLDYGTEVRSFTPGAKSVVSAAWGVADQSSGWKGKQYVIRIKPQSGVATSESYALSDDGKHLVEELRMGGGDFPVVQLKRVYDRSDKAAVRGPPISD